ncbi:hypothetical protein SDC9_107643 [bioreactor metagenome]|uniref:Uncharacterized protein n=1 Tax=bioreactor metagenome TaxID=1076179 RepID=A0A645B5S6_9ZZZZ
MQRADQLVRLDAHVVEEHAARIERAGAQLVDGRVRQAFALSVDHEHGQTIGARGGILQLLGARNHQHLVGRLHARDPDLAAVQTPAIAVLRGKGLDLQRVGARVGLGQRHAAVDLAADDFGQQLFLHLVVAEARDRHAAKDGVDHEQLAHRGAAARGRECLHNQAHLHHAQAAAAVLLGQRHAAQARVAHGLPVFGREGLFRVLLAPVFQPEALTDLASRVNHHPLFIVESEVHGVSLS